MMGSYNGFCLQFEFLCFYQPEWQEQNGFLTLRGIARRLKLRPPSLPPKPDKALVHTEECPREPKWVEEIPRKRQKSSI